MKIIKTINWPDIKNYVNDYEFRGDDGDYIPSSHEKILIEDCLRGYFDDCIAAVEAATVGELPSLEELVKWLNDNLYDYADTDSRPANTRGLAQAILDRLEGKILRNNMDGGWEQCER